ncbi:MAG TPA: hypothetical protein VF700_00680 [Segetibacter sp.]|jgi:hypothetical protein|nr:hypothetical protein [Segetibacter sp.]
MTFKFRTAPVIKSDTVLKLERIGKTMDLLQAIEAERKNHVSNTGKSFDGQIMVERVGSYNNNKGR